MIPNTVHLLLDCGPPQAGLAGLESRRHGVHLLGGELGGVGGHVVAHGHRPLPKVTIECYISYSHQIYLNFSCAPVNLLQHEGCHFVFTFFQVDIYYLGVICGRNSLDNVKSS